MARAAVLALSLGHDPVLDAHELADARLRVASDVARGPDARRARPHQGVDDDAVVDAQAGRLGERDARPHADAHDDEVGREHLAASELDLAGADGPRARRRWNCTPCSSCTLLTSAAQRLAEDPSQRKRVAADHVHLEAALAQRRGDLEADEARADDDRACASRPPPR